MHLLDTPAAGRYVGAEIDPPWKFVTQSVRGQNGKSASAHYPTMTVPEMIAARWPVSQVMARDSWLFVWTTAPHLRETFALVDSWSDPDNPWTYRSMGAWAKRPRGWRGDPNKWQFGTGYLFRSAVEPLLVFGRGHTKWRGTSERNLWIAPVTRHSEKPVEVREMINRVLPEGAPKLEMFCRGRPDAGWHAWGLEAEV